jgi:hypothetical protein
VRKVREVTGSRTRRVGPSLSVVLVLVALAAVVAVGAAFLVLRTRGDALNRPAQPLSDEQTNTKSSSRRSRSSRSQTCTPPAAAIS